MGYNYSQLCFLRYNNYNDRVLKWKTDLAGYLNKLSSADYTMRYNIDFNPGDGVTTTLVVNDATNESSVNSMNYLVVRSSATLEILSRWFIIECARLRNGQYNLVLKRDVLADHYALIENAPIYVQKGMLKNDDPLIFNDEGIAFNQIKKSQTPLMDLTHCGWIVGYIANNVNFTDTKSWTKKIYGQASTAYDDITKAAFYPYMNGTWEMTTAEYTRVKASRINTDSGNKLDIFGDNGTYSSEDFDKGVLYYYKLYTYNTVKLETVANWMKSNKDLTEDFSFSYSADYMQKIMGQLILSLTNGSILDKKTGKVYKISVKYKNADGTDGKGTYTHEIALDENKTAEAAYIQAFQNATPYIYNKNNAYNSLYHVIEYNIAEVTLEEVVNAEATINIDWPYDSNNDYIHLNDMPYSMFCIPVPVNGYDINIVGPSTVANDWKSLLSREGSFAIASLLAEKLGATDSGFIYDLQYLPYCPDDLTRIEGTAGKTTNNGFWVKVVASDGESKPLCPVIFASKSSFEINIDHIINITNNKISHQCDKYRLMSPNFANYEDFDPAMNSNINGFHVICTYKPYTPYINIHMVYGGLYGSDFDDNRGLVLSGDFSVPVISDQWTNYQITNKNYANIFDRQLQNMETIQKYQRAEDSISAIASSVKAAGQGFMMGGAAGAAISGATSLAAGVADIGVSEGKYQEQRSYATDMYNYNLQNIQALPNTLVKSSSINLNNTTWPIIEYYTCTDIEREAFENKLKYNGMTVMRIGTISEFAENATNGWFQGQLIRLPDKSNVDANTSTAIYNELARGVFLGGTN